MKKPIKPLILGALALGGALSPTLLSQKSTYALESNQENFDSPFIITSITPSENTFSYIFNDDSGVRIEHLNLVFIDADNADEALADENSVWLGKMRPYWVKTIYLKYRPTYSVGAITTPPAADFAFYEDVMNDDPFHLFYYAVVLNTNESLTGKIDYGPCVETSVYHEGVECRAELYGPQDQLIYYPYYNGERLVAPDYKYPEGKVEPEPSIKDEKEGPEDANSRVEDTPSEYEQENQQKPEETKGATEEKNSAPAHIEAEQAPVTILASASQTASEKIAVNDTVPPSNIVEKDGTAPTQNKNENDPQGAESAKNDQNKPDFSVVPPLGEESRPQTQDSSPFPIWLLVATFGIAAFVVFFFIFWKRKKDNKEQ